MTVKYRSQWTEILRQDEEIDDKKNVYAGRWLVLIHNFGFDEWYNATSARQHYSVTSFTQKRKNSVWACFGRRRWKFDESQLLKVNPLKKNQ